MSGLREPVQNYFGNNNDIIDPITNFQSIPGLVDLKEKTQVFENQKEQKKILENQCKKQEVKKWYHFWITQGMLALVVAGITAILLYIFNPPMTQRKRKDEYTSEKQSFVKVLGICFLIFILVLVLPEIIRLINVLLNKKKPASK